MNVIFLLNALCRRFRLGAELDRLVSDGTGKEWHQIPERMKHLC